MPDLTKCLISFGSNLGDRGKTLADAAFAIAGDPTVTNFRASRLYATPAIGGPPDQPPFLNAAAVLDTTRSASELLARLQQIETQFGRVRSKRWAARKIDLDIILFGDLIGERQQLAIPHPRYSARRFVVEPAAEVAAEMLDPRFGWSIGRIADHLAASVPSAVLIGGTEALRRGLCERITGDHQIDVLTPSTPASADRRISQSRDTKSTTPWIGDFRGQWDAEIESTWGQPRLVMRLSRHPEAPAQDWFACEMQPPMTRWPSTHQLWPKMGDYPQYILEISDLDWAASEIVSALQSMNCDCQPIDGDKDWPGV